MPYNEAYRDKGRKGWIMMDVLMAGTLLACFGLVWLLAKWCQKQVDAAE